MATTTNWIAARRFLVKRMSDKSAKRILVGLTAPRKLRKNEYPFRTSLQLFGCTVQMGEPHTRHVIHGRDPMEAVLHSLLAIDRFLKQVAKVGEGSREEGTPY